MCGIVGYVGKRRAVDILLEGLACLEYRGYDSAGVALYENDKITVYKEKGRLTNLAECVGDNPCNSTIGIGHTRWATHGAPSKTNSHPHTNSNNTIAVVHNGIIENYKQLREFLINKGYTFVSETDTEVVPNLIDYFYNDDALAAIKSATDMLEGSYALGIMFSDKPDTLYAIRKDSPLIIGLGNCENFIASDIPAILSSTKRTYQINDGEFAVIKQDSVDIFDNNLNPIKKDIITVKFSAEAAQKCGYDHFMLKEINEQPTAIHNTLSGRINSKLQITYDDIGEDFIVNSKKIYIVACGTAYHAGLVGKFVIEHFAGIPVEVVLASEFRYNNPLLNNETSVIVISQSGETADTLASLRMAKEAGSKVVGITNVVGSSVAREADYVFYTYAGPEIAVASTKAYTTQLVALYLLAAFAGDVTGYRSKEEIEQFKKDIISLPELTEKVLELNDSIKEIANLIKDESDIYFLGRGIDYCIALEASLKLKEISYIHSDAYAAGELKHGPIALIEDSTVVITVLSNPLIAHKTASNVSEVVSRGAITIGIVSDNIQDTGVIFNNSVVVPCVSPWLSPVTSIIPLQMLAYYVSVYRGIDVDKPRNLAKSVTVE